MPQFDYLSCAVMPQFDYPSCAAPPAAHVRASRERAGERERASEKETQARARERKITGMAQMHLNYADTPPWHAIPAPWPA